MELWRRRTWNRTLCVFILYLSGLQCVHSSGRCSLFSRQHIHTFDGVIYEFPGDCSYMLAGDCQHRSFSVLGDFSQGKRKGVTLFLGEFFELQLSVDGTLSQGDERIPLPYASGSVFADVELSNVRLWSEDFGFSIRIDPSHNIQLVLDKHHSNQTCGLCGNYNYLREDEFISQEGFLTNDPYDFANSWTLNAADEACGRVSPPSQTCNISGETAQDLMSRCEALSTSALFLRCSHLVDVTAFVSVCEADVCHCGGAECACQVMLEYARSCATLGLKLHDWHVQNQCTLRCPLGLEYSDCSSGCSTSCQTVGLQDVCREECVDGCRCPLGKVLDGDRCVEVFQCSCSHAGRLFASGSSVSQDCNTCVCRHASWECTNEVCPGECLVMGQSHFKSFDGKFFTFSGICQYLLAKDCLSSIFSIFIETAQCAEDEDAVCTHSVVLKIQDLVNQTLHLKHGGVVSLDGLDIQTPLINGALQVQKTVMSSVRLRYGEDLLLDWDGKGRVLLRLSPAYAGKTCGLCGNYNGNQGDDFRTVGGLVETRVEGFGNAWKMNANCESVNQQHSDPCILNPKRVRFAEESCVVLLSLKFQPCHDEVNPGPYVKNCRYDVCSCADGQECLCDAVSSYAAACASRGVLISWRTRDYCEMDCSGGQAYEACGSVCNRTCRSLSLPDTECDAVCDEGCFCPSGLFLSDSGECLPPDRCPCHHKGEIYQPHHVTGDHHAICVCENGSMRCSSNEVSGLSLSDHFSPSRERRSVSCPPPLQLVQCVGVRDSGVECARTCQNLELECVSQGCLSGCMCPAGTVRHRKQCISPAQCPCYHNNRPYASGQSVDVDCNRCVCEERQWKCTERVCDGVCRVIGDTHFIGFDGLKFSFPGRCQYVLAQDHCAGLDGSFRVLLESSACGLAAHHCTKSITVLYMGGTIVMEHGEVRMQKPVPIEAELEIIRSGLYYIVLLGKDISITWDTGTRVSLKISARYRGKVCGLCGNFDGNQNNDILSSRNQLEVDPFDFGNSWKVRANCADAVVEPSQCSTDLLKLISVEQSCRVLTSAPFRTCNTVVDPEPYWEICTHDTCSCASLGDCACFCNAVAAYAHECAQKGLPVIWRSNHLCPLSCEERNRAGGVDCEWRYNACGSACPVTCQRPEALYCPVMCVEGCQAVCPPGKILDEVLMKCVEPAQCQVCVHDGERVSHGKLFVLNHADPHRCQICHCENSTVTCRQCPDTGFTSTQTPPSATTPAPLLTTTPSEQACDRAMDLAFLLDGSSALSEEDFISVKLFILRVVERFRMGSAHTRATVLLFHSGVKSFDMQVQKWMFKKTVRELHYSGGDAAFMDEAIKYLAVYIYDKDKREHVGRVAILLTASANPRPMRSTQRLLRKKDITVLTVVLGPDVDMTQVNDITKATPSSRAYVLNSVSELEDEALVISDYLCTLGLDPEIPKKPTTMPNTDTSTPFRTAPPTAAVITPSPSMPSSDTTFPPSTVTMSEVIFLLESSDEMGEEKFNLTRDALVDVVASLDRDESDRLRVTVIQYSITITVVIRRMELRRKEQVLQKMQKMRWKRGAAVNTGQAVLSVYDSITPTADRTLFLITQSPSSDVIQPLPSSAHTTLYPIGIGYRIKYQDLARLGFPQPPIILDTPSDLRKIRPLLINISLTINKPILPPRPTLPPSVPCSKPIDVLFLLPALPGSQFEVLKAFVRTFLKDSNIGRNGTQVAVMVYGATSGVSVSWRDEQSQNNLIKLLENIPIQTHDTQTELGAALRLAVQTAVSSTSGGRMGVSKSVVVLQTNKSKDSVLEAANEALTAGVSVFPIGLGRQYDESNLKTLAGPQTQNILQLQGLEDLLDSALMGQSFPDKLCRAGPPGVCVDDEGNEREPGETWMLLDGCHSLLCNPSGAVTVQSHRINCEKMEPPTCRNKLPALRLNNTCGCSCSGSSTSHVVSFTGEVLKLRAACSYLLLRSEGAELVLHTAACQSSANQVCMKSVEMKVGETRVEMHDDMKVTLDGAVTLVPVRIGSVSVNLIGAIVHRLRSELHGFTLSFTPHSNQFTIDMDLGVKTNTTGLCGSCSDDSAPQAVTSDLWTLGECVQQEVESCTSASPQACVVLTSGLFGLCHALVPPQDYVQMCNSVACRPDAVCELLAAYSSMCRQQGVCVDWRTSSLCPMPCSDSREYEACRTGCVEQCGQSLGSLGDASDGPLCLITPTEGCFCPNGTVMMGEKCVERDDCNQCVDQHGHTHRFLESWNPEENPCVICVCLDQQTINCTAVSCSKSRAPECGLCEIVREKTGSKCCPEYECVCDPDCQLSDPPQCDDGLSLSLTNPGQCRPFYQCVCRKDLCPLKTQRSCPEHKRLSVRASACCDVYECVCDCENATRTCPPGYITKVFANDCGCTEVSCTADQVCVVDTVVQRVGSVWEETCRSCSCTAQTDAQTGLHIAQCVDTVCNQICPLGSTYTESEGECCGRCRMSSCVEDTRVRPVGEQWTSPHDPCVRSECVQVNQEVFIQHTNVSCHMETPSCPLGTELQCNAADHCCPSCHCAPMDVCMVNQTVIAAGERVMLDVCTSCECVRDKRSYRLSCRKMSCSPCSEGYAFQSIPGACCGHCVATACSVRRPDGQMVTLKANATQTDGCSRHTCVVNQRNELLLETLLTSCPPLDRRRCLESGGQIRQIGDSCCEMCAEPECRRSVKLLDHIRVGECESEEKVEVTFCEGKCSSKSVYSVDKHELESVCSCCSAAGTVPVTVSLRCPNATRLPHQLLAATGCVCTSFACPAH